MAVAEAQSPIIKACWVEGSGVMYRRDTTGAPAACTVATHRPIEWTLGALPGVAIPVPLTLTGSISSAILNPWNSGTGGSVNARSASENAATIFAQNTATTSGSALFAESRGSSTTAQFRNIGTANGGALLARSSAIGNTTAAIFNDATSGSGGALYAENKSAGFAIGANNTSADGSALGAFSQSSFATANIGSTSTGNGRAIWAESKGSSPTITATNNGVANGAAVQGLSAGTNATGDFRNTGNGGALSAISNSMNSSTAEIRNNATGSGGGLYADTKGTGFTINAVNSGANGSALGAFSASSFATANIGNTNTGNGRSIWAESKGFSPTITAINNGSANGAAVSGASQGNNATGDFRNNGSGGALFLENTNNAATTLFVNARGGAAAIQSTSSSQNGVIFENTGTGNNIGILGLSKGVWPTAQFHNTNPSGFSLYAIGNARVDGNLQINGNYVATGTKNAVVPTSTGTREMYTEEATEVWFADYGRATLRDSAVWVPFDGTFSETIESDRPYHVFLQAYADAALFVSRRTAEGFEVRLAGNAAASQPIEFSYRLVAKRRGYSDRRLRPHVLNTTNSKNANVPQELRR